MALKATVYKAEMQIADMDRGYYQTHSVTLALHPSETEERMMVRLLAFALNAHEELQFTKGISTDDEPDLWQKSLTGDIDLWIEAGQPDDNRIRKACNRAQRVILYTYGARGPATWWSQIKNKLTRFNNLTVVNLPKDATDTLAAMAQRTMQLQCTIQDGHAWVSDSGSNVQIEPVVWMGG